MCLLQSGGGGRGSASRHVTSTSRAKEESPRASHQPAGGAHRFFSGPQHHPGKVHSAEARRGAGMEHIRKIYQERTIHSTQDAHSCSSLSRCDDFTRQTPPTSLPCSNHVTRSNHSGQQMLREGTTTPSLLRGIGPHPCSLFPAGSSAMQLRLNTERRPKG